MFTKNQLLGINKDGNNILISAGAGSGKTTVLTQRIVRKLLDGVNINNLLVLTFTNAAANEMKERIKKEIQSDENLKDQLPLVEIANITTFDAYLLTLVQKYSYVIDLNKSIKIGDSVLLEKILNEVIDEKFDILYEIANNENEEALVVKSFLDNYFVFDDTTLKDNIRFLYYKYKNILNKEQLDSKFVDSQINELFKQYEKSLFDIVEDIKNNIQKLREVYTCKKGQKTVDNFIGKYDFINVLQKYDDLIEHTLNSVPKKTTAKIENKELINVFFENINTSYKSLKDKLIKKPKEQILQEEKSLKGLKKFILNLLKEIDKSYYVQKVEYNLFDFADITMFAIEILKENSIREEIKNSFNEILIDEYQDTNDFQNYFIELISNNNIYLVGDVKQSIYGFRNANPQNFNQLQKDFTQNNQEGEVISLLDNFRSREEVLHSVNILFEKLMHKNHSDIDYSDNHALNYGNTTYNTKMQEHDYMMEFLNYEPTYFKETLKIENLKNNYFEPIIIANDVIAKIKNKFQILNNGQLKDIEYTDFAILTKTKSSYKYFKEVFEFYNIPIDVQDQQYVNDEQNYELLVLLSILKLIKIPNNKILEVSILRSFLYQLDDNLIYDYVKNDIEEQTIKQLKETILNIKDMNINNLSLLVYEIFDKFNFFTSMVKLKNVVGINQRLIKIIEVSENFTNAGKKIDDLIDYLEYSLTNTTQRIEIEQTLPSANNVSLMTIHKSKGLEYNIVYLPDLNKELYKTDKININLSSELSVVLPSIKDYKKEDSFLKQVQKSNMQREMVDENIRLLYVAMTRAKEQIIFVSNKEKELKSKSSLNSYESIKKFADLVYSLRDIKQKFNKDVLNLEQVNVDDFIKSLKNKEDNSFVSNESVLKYDYKNIDLKKELIVKTTFSKDQTYILTDNQRKSIDLGNYLHEQLEQVDIKRLSDENYQKEVLSEIDENIYEQNVLKGIILNISKLDFIKDIVNSWTEYEFYYEQKGSQTIGIIDLLVQTNDKIYIIDYKLNNMEDEAYVIQLQNYKKVISEYFNQEIVCYLYSLLQNEIKEIK